MTTLPMQFKKGYAVGISIDIQNKGSFFLANFDKVVAKALEPLLLPSMTAEHHQRLWNGVACELHNRITRAKKINFKLWKQYEIR